MKRCAMAAVAALMPFVRIVAEPEKVAAGNGLTKPITHSEAQPVLCTSRTFSRWVTLEINRRSSSRT